MPTGGGRKVGSANYSEGELRHMLGVLKEIKPIGAEEWQRVVEKHGEKYPGRETESIRRKFASCHRLPISAGDPTCPWHVKEAKAIKFLIGRKAGGDGDVYNNSNNNDNNNDIETGEFASSTNTNASNATANATAAANPTQAQGQAQGQAQESDGAPKVVGHGPSSRATVVGESDAAAPNANAPFPAASLVTHRPNPFSTEGSFVTAFTGGGGFPRGRNTAAANATNITNTTNTAITNATTAATNHAPGDILRVLKDCVELQSRALAQQNTVLAQATREASADRRAMMEELRTDRRTFLRELRADRKIFVEALRVCCSSGGGHRESRRSEKRRRKRKKKEKKGKRPREEAETGACSSDNASSTE